MNRLTAGTVAPDFELPDQNGAVVKLSSLQGKKVLVYFYPKAMTPALFHLRVGEYFHAAK